MPSFIERISSAARAFISPQTRSIAPIDIGWYQGRYGMPALYKPQESLSAYGENVHLHRAVQTIAIEIGRVEFYLRTVDKSGNFKIVDKHQSLEVLARPQPGENGKTMLTGMALKMITGMHLMLNGEAFWYLTNRRKPEFGGAPTFVMPLLPQYMHVNLAEDGQVLEYTYRTGSKETVLDPLNVVHFKVPDPMNFYRGHSPVQSIRYALETKRKADLMNAKRLDNYAVPAGVLESAEEIGEAERRKILAEWRSTYGGAANDGKTAMLPYGLKFNKTQETNRDLQFAEGNAIMRDEVLSAYGVGLEILGRTESQTRANAESAIFVFQRFGVEPFVLLMRDTLTHDFLPAFPGNKGMEYWNDEVVPANMEEKRLNVTTAFSLGAATPNEVRREMGLEPLDLPGMDTPYLDMGKIPVGEDVDISPPLGE